MLNARWKEPVADVAHLYMHVTGSIARLTMTPDYAKIIVGDNLFPRPVPQEDPRQLKLFYYSFQGLTNM